VSDARGMLHPAIRYVCAPCDVRPDLWCPVVVEVLEEYFGLGLRHGEPSIRVDGEPCDDDMQLRVAGKVVTVVTGRTEEIRRTCDHFRAEFASNWGC